MPWIMWRLHVPSKDATRAPATRVEHAPSHPGSVSENNLRAFWQGYDLRLCLETTWHLAVNIGTAYMFLNRGFAWPQEPDKTQRFMW
jgi:alpha-1,2-glucosyltransferase